jgi:hypothetical protein
MQNGEQYYEVHHIVMASLSKSWVSVSALAAFLLFLFFAAAPLAPNVKVPFFGSSQAPDASKVQASKQSVWADLSPSEAGDVVKFLLSKPDLNLTRASKATRLLCFY